MKTHITITVDSEVKAEALIRKVNISQLINNLLKEYFSLQKDDLAPEIKFELQGRLNKSKAEAAQLAQRIALIEIEEKKKLDEYMQKIRSRQIIEVPD